MTTRIVHLGDFHSKRGPRRADLYQALWQVITACSRLEGLGVWIWPGDLFDATSEPDDRNDLDEAIRAMAKVAPVFIVEGNHDPKKDLRGFGHLGSTWPIVVAEEVGCYRVACATGAVLTIFAVPYPDKARLVGAGVSPDAVVSTAADLIEPTFMLAAEQLKTARDAGDLTAMAFHFNIAGSITSTGQPNIGHEIEISARHLDRLGPIPKLGNHIHKPQEIAGAIYAGSMCRLSFGEVEEKSYVVVSMEADGSWRYERRPIDIAPMFLIEGELTRDGYVPDLPIAGDEDGVRWSSRNWTGCDVRARYRYKASERVALDPRVLDELFASALRFKTEGQAVIDHELRAPEVAKATTLVDKLSALQKAPLDERHLAKLSLLERGDRDALLADVTSTLSAIASVEEVAVLA